VIYSERRGQSQKPEEIYHLIEELVPNGALRVHVCAPIPGAHHCWNIRMAPESGIVLLMLHAVLAVIQQS
jgi:hypothetical protein